MRQRFVQDAGTGPSVTRAFSKEAITKMKPNNIKVYHVDHFDSGVSYFKTNRKTATEIYRSLVEDFPDDLIKLTQYELARLPFRKLITALLGQEGFASKVNPLFQHNQEA